MKNLKEIYNQYKTTGVFESVGMNIGNADQNTVAQQGEDVLENDRLNSVDYLMNVYENVLNSIKYSEPDFYRMDLNNPSEYENFVKYIQAELFIKPLIEERMFSDEYCCGYNCRLSNAGLYGVIDFVQNGYDEEDSEYYITNPDKSYVLEMKITGQDKENQPWERDGDVWDCATGVPNPKSEVLNKKFYIDEADSLATTYKNWYHKTYEYYIEYNGEIDIEKYKLEKRDEEFMNFLTSEVTDLSKFNYKLDDDFLFPFEYTDVDDNLDYGEEEEENCGYYLGSLEKTSGCLYLNLDFRNGDRIEKDIQYIDILQNSDDLDEDNKLSAVNDIIKPELFKLLNFVPSKLDESVNVNTSNVTTDTFTDKADTEFDLEHQLEYFLEPYAYPNTQRGETISLGGSLIEDGKGWVDFIEVKCTHISDENLRKAAQMELWRRQYIDRELNGSLIFDTVMSKSRPFRPIKMKYLSLLRWFVRGDALNDRRFGHIEVWFSYWNKKQGLKSGRSESVMFNELPKDEQRRIYDYIVQKIKREQSFFE